MCSSLFFNLLFYRPVFLQSRYEARIFENEKEFVSPLRFQARDDDLKGNGFFLYSDHVSVRMLLCSLSMITMISSC